MPSLGHIKSFAILCSIVTGMKFCLTACPPGYVSLAYPTRLNE